MGFVDLCYLSGSRFNQHARTSWDLSGSFSYRQTRLACPAANIISHFALGMRLRYLHR